MAPTANILLKLRLVPRKSDPLLELAAFWEIPYMFIALVAFAYLYILYFGFFYVSSGLFGHTQPSPLLVLQLEANVKSRVESAEYLLFRSKLTLAISWDFYQLTISACYLL